MADITRNFGGMFLDEAAVPQLDNSPSPPLLYLLKILLLCFIEVIQDAVRSREIGIRSEKNKTYFGFVYVCWTPGPKWTTSTAGFAGVLSRSL